MKLILRLLQVLLVIEKIKGEVFDTESLDCQLKIDKYDKSVLYQRNFLYGAGYRWPDNKVPYEISSKFTEEEVILIEKAMMSIADNACIKWIPHTLEQNYLYITTDAKGCFANLGFNRYRRRHVLNLQQTSNGKTCMIHGIAVHEMLHVLGFAHEQTRPDRDTYVQINWTNAWPQSWPNFFRFAGVNETHLPDICDPNSGATNFDNCFSGFKADTFGYPYDFGSLMHYGVKSFSKNGADVINLLKHIQAGIQVGQRAGMTFLDILKLRSAYSCNKPSAI